MPFDAQTLVEVIEPSDRSCAKAGCSATPAATYTTVHELPGGFSTYVSIWGCAEHADELEELDRQLGDELSDDEDDDDEPSDDDDELEAFGGEFSEPSPVIGWTQRLLPTCLECD